MIVLAGAFLTFVGFLFGGILAVLAAVALDRKLGKEKALLLVTGVLLLFTLWQCAPTPIKVKRSDRPKAETAAPGRLLDIQGDPYMRPSLDRPVDGRNPFRKHSDTHPLPPIALQLPPWYPLPFQLPPTIPGPAPGARRVLRGEMTMAKPGDGSTIPEIPDPVFADYTPVPDDLYDWIFSGGRKNYVYILSIRKDGKTYDEKDPGFSDRLFELTQRVPGWEGMLVEYALIGSEETAANKLEPTDVLKARTRGVSTAPADQHERWFARRSVENLYREALQAHGLGKDPTSSTDIAALQGAARKMADVGRTGKEQRQGWSRAVALLEAALIQARQRAAPAKRAEILEELVQAYVALRKEQAVLKALAEYARTSPNRPEPWLWLGQLHSRSLGIPEEALAYYEAALARSPRNADALMGKGDALTALGHHEAALDAYRRAGTSYEAKVRVAEAQLRLGRLTQAAASVQGALSLVDDGPRALLVHGAVLYCEEDLEKAKETYIRCAMTSGPDALEFRAQACYDLGLTCWRLGQADAAVAAFEACDKALRFGSSPSRFADETVSPGFGRALVSLAAENTEGMRTGMQEAREEAPLVAYHEMLTGMVATRLGANAAAVRAFDRALRLVRTYPELDGWLARTRLAIGEGALRAGTPLEEAAGDFEAAVAFAARASRSEEKADPKAFGALLREAWIRLGAQHIQPRQRYTWAREVTEKVIRRIDREQPGALSLQGYCNYQLAQFGASAVGGNVDNPYDACIRDFQQVKNKVGADDEGEWATWRDYADLALTDVKHWLSLEEKFVSFESADRAREWQVQENAGVRNVVEDDVASIRNTAEKDGTLDDPTFVASSDALFKVGEFEEVRLKLKIPSRNAQGVATNTIVFGIQVQRTGARGGRRTRYAGLGVFYDRGKVAARVGGGQDERYKDGQIHRIAPEVDWPSDGWVEVRIVRNDAREGHFDIWLDAEPDDDMPGLRVFAEGETVSSFKGMTRTNAQLWIGGFSTQAQEWDVQIKDIRVIRRKR